MAVIMTAMMIMLIREAVMREKCIFFDIVQKAFGPPPLSFEHYVVNFSEGILIKVRKRLSQQLSTKYGKNVEFRQS